MHFGLREIAAGISAVALIFCCSCEKHHLGEDPEAQKEQVETGSGAGENSVDSKGAAESPTPAASSTPVEFFPTPSP